VDALPIEVLTKQMPLPGLFLRFIGMAEVLGAIGLILPGLLRIRQGLTPLAAAGLVIVMIGATVLTLATGGVSAAKKLHSSRRSGGSSFDLIAEAA
jgi:uncharacterized membrane protein YphA (DoxX/SURF4 family)